MSSYLSSQDDHFPDPKERAKGRNNGEGGSHQPSINIVICLALFVSRVASFPLQPPWQ